MRRKKEGRKEKEAEEEKKASGLVVSKGSKFCDLFFIST